MGMGRSCFCRVAATLVLDGSGTSWGGAVGVESKRWVAGFRTSSDARTPVGIEEDQQRASMETTKGHTRDFEGKGIRTRGGFQTVEIRTCGAAGRSSTRRGRVKSNVRTGPSRELVLHRPPPGSISRSVCG